MPKERMEMKFPLYVVLIITSLSVADAKINLSAQNNIVLVPSNVSKLREYCADSDVDALLLPFLNLSSFDGSLRTLRFELDKSDCGDTRQLDNQFYTCPEIAKTIGECQTNGKDVLGQLSGLKGFHTDASAQDFSENIWNMFGNGVSENRPFGNIALDGFVADLDTDIESGKSDWSSFISSIKKKFGQKKTYYTGLSSSVCSPQGVRIEQQQYTDVDVVFFHNTSRNCEDSGNLGQLMESGINIPFIMGFESDGWAKDKTYSSALSSQSKSCKFAGVAVYSPPESTSFKNIKNSMSHNIKCGDAASWSPAPSTTVVEPTRAAPPDTSAAQKTITKFATSTVVETKTETCTETLEKIWTVYVKSFIPVSKVGDKDSVTETVAP